MRGKRISLFVILLSLFLTGCWDKKEVEEMSYVVAIGLDMPSNINLKKEQALDVTFQFANPKASAQTADSGGGAEQAKRDIITLTAPDFVTAKNTANSFVTRQVSFTHTMVIAVSEELAKRPEFYNFITTTLKEREIRRETSLLVTEGKAADFIKNNKPEMGVQPHKYFQFIIDRSVETGMVPHSTLNRFVNITDADGDLFLAMYGSYKSKDGLNNFNEEDKYKAGEVPKKGGNPVQFIGSAVFKEGRMIGRLSGEETRASLLLDNTSEIEDMFVSYPDPLKERFKISARIRKKVSTEVKMKRRKGLPPKIDVKVPLELELVSIPSMIGYGDDLKKQKILKDNIEGLLEKRLTNLVQKSQETFKSEPFYWSLEIRPLFSSVKEYESWDWTKKNFPYADIHVEVDVRFIGFGKQIKEGKLEKVRD
ncbi:Ger(x)C family spore germination protein [Bacillus sp. 1P10SD]|uniref:Ger(x)C family spore germination protein n=1 Tax=Bacillus sp. 1P10SD TaxID=3132265 RepID=UPI0039A52F95